MPFFQRRFRVSSLLFCLVLLWVFGVLWLVGWTRISLVSFFFFLLSIIPGLSEDEKMGIFFPQISGTENVVYVNIDVGGFRQRLGGWGECLFQSTHMFNSLFKSLEIV